jgi:hypothetical protein
MIIIGRVGKSRVPEGMESARADPMRLRFVESSGRGPPHHHHFLSAVVNINGCRFSNKLCLSRFESSETEWVRGDGGFFPGETGEHITYHSLSRLC